MPVLTERERAYVEICARDMHPDLYEGIKESEAARQLRKRYTYADQMEDLRRVYLLEGFELPFSVGSMYFFATVRNYTDEFKASDYIDVKESLRKMRRMVATIRSNFRDVEIKKEYTDTAFAVDCVFPSGLKIRISVDRAVVCTKKVVGTEYVTPQKGYTRDIVEWDCTPVSLLKGE